MSNERPPFKPPFGHRCKISTGIHGCPTFGTGTMDHNGFWERGCDECARAWEQQFPEDGPCWPHTDEYLADYIVAMSDMEERDS